jgi:hypothetical protein
MTTINLIVTCTKRKTQAPARSLMLRDVPKVSPDERVAAWVDRITQASGELCAVRDLYSGDHWSIARDLDGVAIGPRGRLRVWVVSAGYGLLRLDNRLHSYSATFAVRHPDSVIGRSRGLTPVQTQRQWWKRLTAWSGPWPRQPRTIAAVAAEWPRSPLIVVASEIYLQSLRDDLWEARQQLADPKWLSIVSAGSRDLQGMAEHLVPCDARLESLVGGARRSLNMRVARQVLNEIGPSQPTLPVLRDRFAELLAKAPAVRTYDREPLTDDQVLAFIGKSVNRDPRLRGTPLLRRLRDDGFACEYSRFMKLFRSIRE